MNKIEARRLARKIEEIDIGLRVLGLFKWSRGEYKVQCVCDHTGYKFFVSDEREWHEALARLTAELMALIPAEGDVCNN